MAAGAVVEDPGVLAILREVQGELGMARAPALRTSRRVPGPLSAGLFRPVVFLPLGDYSGEELYFIFRHELTHCRRRDVAYKLLLLLANAAHWFNPLVWLMFREAGNDLELSCDEEALAEIPREGRLRYSQVILNSVSRRNTPGAALTTHFSGGARALGERFANILAQGARRRGILPLCALTLATALAGGMAACGGTPAAPPPSTSAGSSSPESSSGTGQPQQVFLEPSDFDEALMEELSARMGLATQQGADAPGGMGEFIAANPNFLWEQSRRVKSNRGNGVQEDGGEIARLLPPGTGAPEQDLMNRGRLADFVANCRAGVPDQIVILSPGSPVPFWVTIYTTREGGSYTVESFFRAGGEEVRATTAVLRETGTEWLLVQEEGWKTRYPKYGYEPIPLTHPPGEADPGEAQRLLEELLETDFSIFTSEMNERYVQKENRVVNGWECMVFEGEMGDGTYTGDSFAVALDLSRIYQVEQVNGQWMLLARPKRP